MITGGRVRGGRAEDRFRMGGGGAKTEDEEARRGTKRRGR